LDNARKAAYLALRDVEENKAYSGIAVQNAIRKVNPERVSFVRELVYGTIKRQLYLDHVIGLFVKTPVHKLPASDRILLRMGICQHSSLDSVPDYAAVSETVELAKRYARGREKFINGVLRQYIREKDNIALPPREENEARYLSVKHSFSPWIVEMWLKEYESPQRVEHLLDALNQRPDFCIRANTLKAGPEELKSRLESLGFAAEADEDMPDLLFVESPSGEKPLDTDLFKEGLFSVQDKSSQIAAESLGAQPGDTVVDVCAAPGGKTMALAAAMKNIGRIYAMDIYEHKLGLINKEAVRLGASIVKTRLHDGRAAAKDLVGAADRVLVDAPCSGLGTARRKPEVKYKEREEVRKLPELQLGILKASAEYVKPGGTLVYSTCTISKQENEDVVKSFLEECCGFELVDMIQLLPVTGRMDGFFVCRLKRMQAR